MCAKVLAGGGAYPVAGPGGRGGTGEGEIDTDEKGTCPLSSASSSGPDLQVSSPL